MLPKRMTALSVVMALGIGCVSNFIEVAAEDKIPEPVWSAGFEGVTAEKGAVTAIIPEIGTAELIDSGSNGYDITLTESYNGSRALRINNGDYLKITKNDGNAPVIASDTGITVSYWVKVYSGTVSWGFFEIKDGVADTNNKRYYFGVIDNNNKLRWESQNGENTALEKTSVNLGDWHMVTVTYGENGSYMYIDGAVIASNTEAYPNGSIEDIIGDNPAAYIGYAYAWDEHADIAIDDYRIYNTQLSDEQIASIYIGDTERESGVYLDGTAMDSFDAAVNAAISDADAGSHELVIYSDAQTSQNSWIKDNAIDLTVVNSDSGVVLEQTSKNPIFRISKEGASLTLGKEGETETDEITALTFDGGGLGRTIDMQAPNGIADVYGGTIITNGNDTRGGGIDNKSGTVNIYGGIIKNNVATGSSGGGGIDAIGTGIINMYGGLITDNTSDAHKGGGAAVTENGEFHMYGGMITGNDGYDVYVGNNNFYMSGSAYAGNVYLADGKCINVEAAFDADKGHAIIKPESYETGKAVVTYADGLTPRASDFYVMSDDEQAYTLAVEGQNLVLEPCERTYIESLYETACAYPTIDEGAEYIKNELSIGNVDGLTENVSLPVADETTDGFGLSWTTDNSGVITADGVITRPERGKVSATLTATIVFKGITLTRDITVVVNGYDAIDYTFNISSEKDVDISDDLYGLFFEDINYSTDGGLYAEMVENRSFESVEIKSGFTTEFDGLDEWSSNDTMIVKDSGGLNDNNPHYLEFTGKSFENSAYDGIYMQEGKKYNVSFWAKTDSYSGAITVSAGNNSVEVVSGGMTDEWTKYEAVLTAVDNVRKVPLEVTLSENGTVDFDMISVIPDDAVYGIFRKDLVEMLKNLDPGFLRFPGGCIVEGGTIDNYYNWKDTVGSLEERKQNWNKWGSYGGNATNYNQTYGIGYYEYFLLCEYLECQPMPILNVGLACQNIYPTLGDQLYPIGSDEFNALVQDALDLIEFANSMDFENSKWARLRRDMGHEKPFNLKMIGIGNEQWDTSESQYYERYSIFEQAIHEKYPDMQLIGCSMRDKTKVWDWVKTSDAENPNYMYALDEHGYNSAEWFF